MSTADKVYAQFKLLPEPLAREVLAFVGTLRDGSERAEWRDVMAAQAASLDDLWDNSEDAVWDTV